jgi:acetylornithine deacetylase/succinyl-diaminopimelate desuccinylase-like protein
MRRREGAMARPMSTQPRPLTPYERLGDWIDNHLDESIAFLRELVRIPTDTPPGDNARHAARTAELLTRMGFVVERHPVPAADAAASGLASIVNLVVRRRFGDGPVIALNVHGDAVPPGAGWTHPPYAGDIADGRMYGRGVAVSKSDFATYVYALRALAALGTLRRGTLELHVTYDEEFGGSVGPQWLLARGIVDPDYAICPGFSYAIGVAHNGSVQLEVIVHGRAAHAALPATGVDALRAAHALMDALYAHAGELASVRSSVTGIASPTLVIGKIDGGINTNVVPDRVRLALDRRVIPEERADDVEYALRALLERVAATLPGITLEVRRLLRAWPLAPLPGHEAMVDALSRHASAIVGEPVAATGTPLYTDARLYGEHDVPTVLYGAGPRSLLESNAKRADENLVLDDLRKATKVIACALHDLLADAPPRERAALPQAIP